MHEPTVTDVAGMQSGLPWPEEYQALLPAIKNAWGIETEIYLTRKLSGKSGALVFAADISTQAFAGQAILKLGPAPEAAWNEQSEAERHSLASESAPDFAARHLPTLLHSLQDDSKLAILSSIAGRGLEYAVPWHACSHDRQLEVIRRVFAEMLEEWNRGYSIAPGILEPHTLLQRWLDYRLDPDEGRIHTFVREDCELPPEEPSISFEGHWYPNPLAFAMRVIALPDRVHTRAVTGLQHGDFHGYNLLVGTAPAAATDYFLIDLANFECDQFLFFDHALFELNYLLARRAHSGAGNWESMLDQLSNFRHLESSTGLDGDDVGLVELIQAMRRSVLDWVDRHESHRLSYMESQYLLARVAAGLAFCNKPISRETRRRAFLYAAGNLKDYLKINGIDWPKYGPAFEVSDDTRSEPHRIENSAQAHEHRHPELPDKPAIAVLAFENLSNDADQEYFADGISLEILTALSRIDWLMVISRGSTFAYKGQASDPTRVARELGVHYVVEGDVRKSADRVRVSSRLVDGFSGRTVWVERYERAVADIFALQDEIAQSIVDNIDSALKGNERETAHRRHGQVSIWDRFQNGLWHVYKFTGVHHVVARQQMVLLTEMAPDFALPHAVLAFLDTRTILRDFPQDRATLLKNAMDQATLAVSLDESSSLAHVALGRVNMLMANHEEAISECETAIALNPSSAAAYANLAGTLCWSGRADVALEPMETSIRLSPRGPDLPVKLLGKLWFHYLLGNLEEAERLVGRVPTQEEIGVLRGLVKAALRARQNRVDEARACIDDVLSGRSDLTVAAVRNAWQHMHHEYLERFTGDLETAGLPRE